LVRHRRCHGGGGQREPIHGRRPKRGPRARIVWKCTPGVRAVGIEACGANPPSLVEMGALGRQLHACHLHDVHDQEGQAPTAKGVPRTTGAAAAGEYAMTLQEQNRTLRCAGGGVELGFG